MQDRHFCMFRSMCRQYDICIFRHSKLPVERTTKSFARNSRVLGEQRYYAYTQRFTSYDSQSVQSSKLQKGSFWWLKDNFSLAERLLLLGNSYRFAWQKESFGTDNVVVLQLKSSNIGVKEGFWWGKKHKKRLRKSPESFFVL